MEFLLVSLLIFFLPSQFGLHFWPSYSFISGLRVDYLSPTFLFTDLIVLPLLFIYLKQPLLHLRHKLVKDRKFYLLILLILINLFFSLRPGVTFFKYLRLLEYSLLIYYFLSHPKYLFTSFSHLFPFSLLLVDSLAWLQFLYQHSIGGLWYFWGERFLSLSTPGVAKITLGSLGLFLRPYSFFSHPNSLAGFLLVSGLILYHFYLRSPTRPLLISLIFTAVTLPLTFSRTAILLETLVFIVLFFKSSFLILSPLLLSPLLFFAGNPSSFSDRFTLFNIALRQILLHPLTGLGFGNFPVVSPSFQPVHSLLFLALSELGLPLFFYLLYLMRFFVISLFHLPLSFRLAWFCVFVTGLVDHYWISLPQNLLLISLLIALSLHFSSANH